MSTCGVRREHLVVERHARAAGQGMDDDACHRRLDITRRRRVALRTDVEPRAREQRLDDIGT
jgi:hypothetical protein